MRKKISPVWFLKDPLDPEYKEYILLGHLKKLSQDLDTETCYSIMKDISILVRVLSGFKLNREIDKNLYGILPKKERNYIKSFDYDSLGEIEKSQLMNIVESSLQTLYDFSEVCLEILKGEEDKIKIFKIQSKFSKSNTPENSGIVIIRNMVTDKILNFYFKVKVKMETSDGQKEISIMKKINLKNDFFSLNYEYIYHEILEEIQQKETWYSTSFYVIEIYENFDEDSEIYKLAKEKFIAQV